MSAPGTTTLSLDTLFTLDGLLADRDGDHLPDAVRACLVLGAASEQPEHRACVDLAARLGFETVALAFPLACTDRAAVPAGAVPIFAGRPDTLAADCPAGLADALTELQPDEGIVAIGNGAEPALLVGGGGPAGLAGATRLLATGVAGPAAREGATADLAALCRRLRAALATVGLTVVVESMQTRQDRLSALRLRAVGGTAAPDAVQHALTSSDGGNELPCDVVVALPAGREARLRGSRADAAAAGAPAVVETVASLPPLRSLAGVYGPAGFAVDTDGDLLPDVARTHITLPDDLSAADAVAAAHLAARLGLESLGLALPLGAPADGERTSGDGVVIAVAQLDDSPPGGAPLAASEGEVRLLHDADSRTIVHVRGDARGRAAALSALAGLDPWTATEEEPSLDEVERALNRVCALADPDAWLAAVLPALQELPRHDPSVSPQPLRLAVRLPAGGPALPTMGGEEAVSACIAGWAAQRWPGVPVEVDVAAPLPTTILDEAWPLSWEVDEVWEHVGKTVLPALLSLPPTQNDWFLDVRVSEPAGRRRGIKRELLQAIRAAGVAAGEDQVRVLPAYRQGRAWLTEEVVPRLAGRGVAALTVRVRRFASDDPCLELPVRWLQDLHPVDEFVAEQLGLPHGAVRFELGEEASTYAVEARDGRGDVVWQSSFDVLYGRRPYLPGFPAWGAVHPPVGCVRLLVAGAPVVDARIAPDPERAWNRVQESLLPRLREHILATTAGVPRPELQPFFDHLTVDMWLSEEDEALGLREEWTSPLESLHEDLYFMLLDYCSALLNAAVDGEPFRPPWVQPPGKKGTRRGARLWTAPGLIVPRIHRRDGAAGRVRVQLVAAGERGAALRWQRGDDGGTAPLRPAGGVTVRVVGLRVTAQGDSATVGGRRLLVEFDGPAEEQEHARQILAGWDELRTTGVLGHPTIPPTWTLGVAKPTGQDDWSGPTAITVRELSGRDGGQNLSWDESARTLPASPSTLGGEPAAGAPDGTAHVPWDRVLGVPDIEAALEALGRSPRAYTYRAGRSAQGRPSYAVELTVPRGEGLWSRAKLSGWKCTLMLNARHHGNEPSSTSALLRLAELLAFDEGWRHYLDRVNVVLIPCENPDGAALSEALQDEHPTWMLHAGRYNAAGLEFVAEYTKPYTRHTEALVLPRLWHRWAPDISCDDHGFPSHEWVQLFSGHSNPWFQSHWISQGLIYLILPRVTNPRYAQHARAVEDLQKRLTRALAADPEIRGRNSAYVDRYRTYLSDWLPDAFPAPIDDDVMVHTFDYDPDDQGSNGISLAGVPGAHPGVTTVSLVTEVADETAQGRYMALCAHTHLLADRALLDYLFDVNAPAAIERGWRPLPDGRVLLRTVRPRPALPLSHT